MRIETARLLLRPFVLHDLPEMTALLADPGFMAWSVAGPVGAAAARRKLEGKIASFESLGFSKLAMSLRDDPRLIGYCGLGLEVIGGLATEAARAVIDDAFGRLALPELHAYAEPGNAPSHRVIARLGMTYLRDIRLHDRRWRLYRLRRPD